MSVTDRDLGWKKLRAQLTEMKGSYVKVGVQQNTRRDDDHGSGDMVTVAVANEFGVRKADGSWRIPPRPAVQNAYDQHREGLVRQMAAEKDRILAGRQTTRQALDRVGLLHTAQVQASVRSNTPPPNAPATVAEKQSSRTLIDSGQFVQSIRHVSVVGGRVAAP